MRDFFVTMTMAAVLFGGEGEAFAVVPDLLPVQGTLTDSQDTPLDGAVDMTFSLYNAESSGTVVWTDEFVGEQNAVQVDDGFFSVYLGSQKPLNFLDLAVADELWLGIRIGTDEEMPLIRVATVPFAGEAQVCHSLGELDEADAQMLAELITGGSTDPAENGIA